MMQKENDFLFVSKHLVNLQIYKTLVYTSTRLWYILLPVCEIEIEIELSQTGSVLPDLLDCSTRTNICLIQMKCVKPFTPGYLTHIVDTLSEFVTLCYSLKSIILNVCGALFETILNVKSLANINVIWSRCI